MRVCVLCERVLLSENLISSITKKDLGPPAIKYFPPGVPRDAR